MTVVRAIGFDLDGTLFDHLGSARSGASAFLDSLGVEVSDSSLALWFAAENEHFERWRSGQISFQEQRRERLRATLPPLGVTVPTEDDALDALFDIYARAYESSWRAFPDSLPLLRELRSGGYRIGLLANGAESEQVEKLRHTGLLNAIDVVCTSERIGVQKPDPRAFTILAAELDVEAAACLFIGDNAAYDVEAARRAGMRALLIDRYEKDGPDVGSLIRSVLAVGAATH